MALRRRIDEHSRIEDPARVELSLRGPQRRGVGLGALAVVPRAVVAAHGVMVGDGAPAAMISSEVGRPRVPNPRACAAWVVPSSSPAWTQFSRGTLSWVATQRRLLKLLARDGAHTRRSHQRRGGGGQRSPGGSARGPRPRPCHRPRLLRGPTHALGHAGPRAKDGPARTRLRGGTARRLAQARGVLHDGRRHRRRLLVTARGGEARRGEDVACAAGHARRLSLFHAEGASRLVVPRADSSSGASLVPPGCGGKAGLAGPWSWDRAHATDPRPL
jgi:hypothetical protein